MSKIKLSPKQKEVIQLMREGWEMKESCFANIILVKNTKGLSPKMKLSITTYVSLKDKKIIKVSGNECRRKIELTQLGKTIQL